MKLSDAVAMALSDDGALVGRDDKGVYVEWDEISIPLDGKTPVSFRSRGVVVGRLNPISFASGDVLNITHLEGRIRVRPD